jgi:hypothetical protein
MKVKNRFLKSISPEMNAISQEMKPKNRFLTSKNRFLKSISPEMKRISREIKIISLVFFSLFYPKTGISIIPIILYLAIIWLLSGD